MFQKIIKKLAQKYIDEAFKRGVENRFFWEKKGYFDGYDEGYANAKKYYTKGCFKKGNTPWNKGGK